jgi:lysozyme
MSETPVAVPKVAQRSASWVAIAVTFISLWEGVTLVGVHFRVDPPSVNTVCYGHIEDVQIGDRYTKTECQEMLAKDIPRYDAMVSKCVQVPLPPHRHAAIVSFTYNVGGGALCKSSVVRYLNVGNVQAGCDALLQYDRANGVVLQGLKNRRVAERKLCLMDD